MTCIVGGTISIGQNNAEAYIKINVNTSYKYPTSEKYVLNTANINPTPNIRHNNNAKGIIAYIIVAWNGAWVINITPNKITNDIKKLMNS